MKRQSGIGLVEIMVTVVIVSVSILATIRLQAGSLQDNHQAWLRSCADMMANDMFERLLANSNAALAGSYEHAEGGSIPSASNTSMAQVDLRQWLNLLASQLPGGDGSVTCTSAGMCTVSVYWTDPSIEDDTNSDGAVDEDDQQTSIRLVSAL
ncbi:type IV pilus modification protein PilV [Parathalassolituus penaei]|uniref:Type IV pilus modification protein PilV n=1 Tax=Parathalassolituus penaei TaxID=2997323 RepID=A0A9X3EDM9_9GAMM|nr:type IV pilus modification protein PilV [Parathalassolituus penaei]MCY0964780.1 type IV pilus modification protein PilV [Parathalassolituus penaei]